MADEEQVGCRADEAEGQQSEQQPAKCGECCRRRSRHDRAVNHGNAQGRTGLDARATTTDETDATALKYSTNFCGSGALYGARFCAQR